jgi:hypothetical protein
MLESPLSVEGILADARQAAIDRLAVMQGELAIDGQTLSLTDITTAAAADGELVSILFTEAMLAAALAEQRDILMEEVLQQRQRIGELQSLIADSALKSRETRGNSEDANRYDDTDSDHSSVQSQRSRTRSKAKKRSSKTLPDPDKLSDGKQPSFEGWSILMREKLRRDRHLFPSQRDKIGYIFARTDGKASEALIPRLKPGAFRLKTADDAFQALANLFQDRHRKSRAKTKFRQLVLREGGDYHQFHTSFMNLALVAEIPPDEYKSELAYRLPESIARQVVEKEEDSDCDFDEFQQAVSLQAYAAEKRAQRHLDRHGDRLATTSSKQADRATSRARTTTPAASATKSATPAARAVSSKSPEPTDGSACYNCGGKGHMARDCPSPRPPRAHPVAEVHLQTAEESVSDSLSEDDDFQDAPLSKTAESKKEQS